MKYLQKSMWDYEVNAKPLCDKTILKYYRYPIGRDEIPVLRSVQPEGSDS